MPKIIAIDCDLPLAASDVTWWEWMCSVTGTDQRRLPTGDVWIQGVDYNLGSYFDLELENNNVDPMDFWRATNVYDWVKPIKYSQEALVRLKEAGYTIVVVSHIKGNHHKSKYNWLKRHYGDTIDAFVATKEKWTVKCDYLIDDRISHLNSMPEEVTRIQFATPYTQDVQPKGHIYRCEDWPAVTKLLQEIDG